MDTPSQRERPMPSVPIKIASSHTIVCEVRSSVEFIIQACHIAHAGGPISAESEGYFWFRVLTWLTTQDESSQFLYSVTVECLAQPLLSVDMFTYRGTNLQSNDESATIPVSLSHECCRSSSYTSSGLYDSSRSARGRLISSAELMFLAAG
jgi:hypothetical protein